MPHYPKLVILIILALAVSVVSLVFIVRATHGHPIGVPDHVIWLSLILFGVSWPCWSMSDHAVNRSGTAAEAFLQGTLTCVFATVTYGAGFLLAAFVLVWLA